MMTLPRRPALITLLCLGLMACAVTSPPIYYLQLSAGDVALPQHGGTRVFVDAVTLPDFLLRDELLLRDSEFSLRYRVDRRWAEPLDMGIQRVLARRLAATLQTRELALFPAPPGRAPYWELAVDVQSFEVRDNRAVLAASATWTHRGETADPAAGRQYIDFEASEALDDSEAAAAVALSSLLWQFADALAEPLSTQSAAGL